MRMLSTETALLISLLLFAALVFWVLFANRSKLGGENAAIIIVFAVAVILAVLVGMLQIF